MRGDHITHHRRKDHAVNDFYFCSRVLMQCSLVDLFKKKKKKKEMQSKTQPFLN